jgi:hypothetical protein
LISSNFHCTRGFPSIDSSWETIDGFVYTSLVAYAELAVLQEVSLADDPPLLLCSCW